MISKVELESVLVFGILWIFVLVLPEITFRLEISVVPFFLVVGMLLGPYGLKVVPTVESLRFIGTLGLLFLIFIAGLEVHKIGKIAYRESIIFSIIISIVSFFIGFFVGVVFNFDLLTSAVLGTVFQSSSVGDIIYIVNTNRTLRERYGTLIITALIVVDVISLTMFSIFINVKKDFISTMVTLIEFVVFLFTVFLILPYIGKYIDKKYIRVSREFRVKILTLVILSLSSISLLLGMHPISAMFLSGVLLGKYVDDATYEKLESAGHIFFIPFFFLFIGLETDFRLIFSVSNYALLISIISMLMLSKLISGFIYSGLRGIKGRDSLALGVAYFPQLSATLAATEIAYSLGIFSDELRAAIVALCIFTVLLTPFIVKIIYKNSRADSLEMENHVVIIGSGVPAEYTAAALYLMKVPFIIVDDNTKNVKYLREKGYKVLYRNPLHKSVPVETSVDKASLVVITLQNPYDCLICAKQIKKYNSKVKVIAMFQSSKDAKIIKDVVDEVVVPEVVTGLNLIWLALKEVRGVRNENEKNK